MCMCEHIKDLAEDSIRSSSVFPSEVEEHLESCTACSQYISLAILVASTGRPPIQLPPVELSHRIAMMTYAKQATWQKFLVKPAVFVPALGVVAAAGWLLSGLSGGKEVAKVDTRPSMIVTPDVVTVPTQGGSKDVDVVKQPTKTTVDNVVAAVVKRPAIQNKQRPDVKLVSETKTGDIAASHDVSIGIHQKPQVISPDVRASDITVANVGASRIPDIATTADHRIDVQAPVSARHSVGRASLVLAAADEESDRDELRASFQSQLNQQSDAFRSTVTHGAQQSGDSSRINVVNAPVVTGGK